MGGGLPSPLTSGPWWPPTSPAENDIPCRARWEELLGQEDTAPRRKERDQEDAGKRWGDGGREEEFGGQAGQGFQSMGGLIWSLGSPLTQGKIEPKRSSDHKGFREDGGKLKGTPCRVST